ncbi:MAG: CRISPR-associated endonuclease Cas2 [Helicobacteraceae bacterium]|jgi:CRISPR-associated endonuclease Cas2|nr:CRISPR-associated endonuclease Cas2 [Helicobacteraceae bacterium]
MRKPYLVCYDVSDHKRRQKLARYLYARSTGGQKSALNVHIHEEEAAIFVNNVLTLTKPSDLVNIVAIRGKIAYFGKNDDLKYFQGAIVL